MSGKNVYHSNIWEEEAEADNPFATKAAYCQGYDVYGDLLGKASWIEYLYLMFKGDKPSKAQAAMLENLAVAFANCGPRDHSVRAAMNGGVGGSVAAGSLMASLAVGAGQYGGAHEVFHAVELWNRCGLDSGEWLKGAEQLLADLTVDIWLPMEHVPGFDPNGVSCAKPVLQTLALLVKFCDNGALKCLQDKREAFEASCGYPLSMTGVAAAAFFDLGFSPQQAEMLFLIMRLPGAAVHALEQQEMGWKKFPFVGGMIRLENDPGSKEMPSVREYGL